MRQTITALALIAAGALILASGTPATHRAAAGTFTAGIGVTVSPAPPAWVPNDGSQAVTIGWQATSAVQAGGVVAVTVTDAHGGFVGRPYSGPVAGWVGDTATGTVTWWPMVPGAPYHVTVTYDGMSATATVVVRGIEPRQPEVVPGRLPWQRGRLGPR